MTRQQRLRTVATLCADCIKNIAFKRCRRPELVNGSENQFWLAIDGNFLDICVLRWCELFADKSGQHYWKKVIIDHHNFFSGLLKELNCREEEFERHIYRMKTYRNSFMEHLDDKSTEYYPLLNVTKVSSIYLYEYLFTNEAEGSCLHDMPNIRECYSQCLAEGNRILKSILVDRTTRNLEGSTHF